MGLRILYVIDSLGVGGAEVLLLSILREARARGHVPHLAYFTPGPLQDDLSAAAASVTRIGRHGLRDPRALWRMFRLIRRLRPDIVHSHLTKSDLVAMPAATLAGVGRRIVTLHNTDRWRQNRVAAAVYRVATAGAHHLVAVSGQVRDHMLATRSARPDRLRVIANGVDLARFRDLPPPLGDPQAPVVFAIIGRLHPQKDHATFLAAARLLVSAGAAARFVVVGDGPLRGGLQAASARLGLDAVLRFAGTRADIAATLAETDVVVLSSAWEGLPMALLEGMAAARPVIATAVGEIPALLRDGIEGLVVPPGDPQALARAMAEVLTDRDRARRMGQAGRARVAQQHDAGAMLDRIFALYAAPVSAG